MRKGFAGFIVLIFLLSSCSEQKVFDDYHRFSNEEWMALDTVSFKVELTDTLEAHNLYLNIRNNDKYRFSNLFLITTIENPSGDKVIDTLEYQMAKPDGEWLGKGKGVAKENKLWFKENIVFPSSGVYEFKINHAMRENGTVNGIDNLQGIMDVGMEIEKASTND